jgi:hypothetical protein
MVKVPGGKLSPIVTLAVSVSPVKPGAEAIILVVPNAMPFRVGCVAGVWCWKSIKTLVGVIVAFEVSVLDKVMVTPPAGAPLGRVTG